MFFELVIDNTDVSSIGFRRKEEYFSKGSNNLNSLVVISSYAKLTNYPEVTSLIDFPYGVSDTELRLNEIEYAAKNKAKCVDLVVNQRLLLDKNTEAIYNDFLECKKLCVKEMVEVRCAIEYRLNTSRLIIEVAKILESAGLKKLILGVNIPDNTTDLILLCQDLIRNTNLELIVGVSQLNEDVISSLSKIGVSGVRKRCCSIGV